LKLRIAPLLAVAVLYLAPLPAWAICGDGVLDPDFEACDDGNNVNGDGCESECHLPLYVAVDGSDETGTGTARAPYRTIQKAFEEAQDFTKIIVGPGTYNECVLAAYPVALDRPVQIVAAAWETEQDNTATVITGAQLCDASQAVPNRAAVVRIASRQSKLEGFTITDGGASGINASGSVVITNNVITGNFSTSGGGIYFFSATYYFAGDIEATISNNTIRGNRAVFGVPPLGNPDEPTGGEGGGIFVYAVGLEGDLPTSGTATVTIDNNVIENNTIQEDSPLTSVKIHGAGLGVFSTSSPGGVVDVVITNNTISGNSVASGSAGYSGGAWLYTYGYGTERFIVRGNTIENNTAILDGGGLSAWIDTFGTRGDGDPSTDDSTIRHSVDLEDNVIRNNSSAGSAGGLDLDVDARNLRSNELARIDVRNNEITGNTSKGGENGGGGGVLAAFKSVRSATPDSGIRLEQNRIQGNTAEVSGGGISIQLYADGDPEDSGSVSFAAADVVVTQNLIVDNAAPGPGALGGGVFAYLQSFVSATATATLDRSTVAGNLADSGAGGVEFWVWTAFDDPPNATALARLEIDNSIIADNDGVGVGGPVPDTADGGEFSLDMTYTDVFGHPFGEYESWIEDPTGLLGNISEDPLLQGADYLPAACSPTLDAASPSLEYSLEPPPNGGRANMGHSGGTASATPSLADLNGDAVVDGIDVLRLSVSFGSASGDARYSAGVDVNGDGVVDGDDLAYVANEFGDSCD